MLAVILTVSCYNYRGLRERLSLCGHRFAQNRTRKLRFMLGEEWGEDALTELRGMFAFALLDLRRRYATAPILFLARDPMGISSFITPDAARFCVPSEVRALLATAAVPKQTVAGSVTAYLILAASRSR